MFRFANAGMLWWLLGVVVLLLLCWLYRWRRVRRSDLFAQKGMQGLLMPYASKMRFWVRSLLFLVGISALIVGLARPQFGMREVKTKREGVEIMLVLDVSNSMNAQDVKPSRLARAKLEISKLLERMRQDRIGLCNREHVFIVGQHGVNPRSGNRAGRGAGVGGQVVFTDRNGWKGYNCDFRW